MIIKKLVIAVRLAVRRCFASVSPLLEGCGGTRDRYDRRTSRTTGRIKEAQGTTMPDTAKSSSRSSSESSTGTEVGLVDVCNILSLNISRQKVVVEVDW